MWGQLLHWLLQHLSGPRERIEPHPPLAGDRDERRLEQARFEAQTRHAGRDPHAGGAPPARRAQL